MKKFLTLTFVIALILGMTAATYAMEIKTSGLLRARTALLVNAVPGFVKPNDVTDPTSDTGFDETQAWTDSRFRIKFEAVASENLSGVIQLEGDSTYWGETAGAGAQRNQCGRWTADSAGVEVKHYYISFKVPGTDAFPTRLTVGTQGFLLGRYFALDDDGSGLTVSTKAGPASIQLMWMKYSEGPVTWVDSTGTAAFKYTGPYTYHADDVDAYAAGVSFPVGAVIPNVWTIYTKMGTNYTSAPAGAGTVNGYDWHFGVGLDGKVGPVALEGDFVYGLRNIDYATSYLTTATFNGITRPVVRDGEKFSGWLAYIKGSVPVSMFTVGAEFFYSTGDDKEKVAYENEHGGYYMPLTNGAEYLPGIVYHGGAFHDGMGIRQTVDGGGDWLIKAFASVNPLDWLKVTFQGMYIGDTVKNGDRIGNSVDALGNLQDNSNIGIELDLIGDIQIYKELVYTIGAGILFAGSALDMEVPGNAAVYGLPGNQSPKNPWAVISQLLYKF